jgi:ABC-2 type transport system permease protein
MIRALRLARAVWRFQLAIILEYRVTVFLWILAGVTPLVMMFVWMEIAGSGPVGTRAPVDFARYFLIAFLVTQTTQTWAVWEIDYLIRAGTFSHVLVKPYDPWWEQVLENLAGNGVRLPLIAIIVIVGLWLSGAISGIAPGRLPLFLLALFLANQIAINLSYAMALVALWTERIKSVDAWNYIALAVLGGQVFPLDLLPPGLAHAIDFTPWRWIIAFPVTTLAEPMASGQILRGLAAQATWIAIFIALHRVLWRLGIKRFGAVGG